MLCAVVGTNGTGGVSLKGVSFGAVLRTREREYPAFCHTVLIAN